MLVHQAALQLTLWTGLEAPVDAMWRAVSRHAALGASQ
jgi:shikimate 5-dehydrogenase